MLYEISGVDILDPTYTRLAIGLKAQKTHGASFSDGVNSGLNNIDNFSCLKFLSINISRHDNRTRTRKRCIFNA